MQNKLIWIIGYSNSGKSTLARALQKIFNNLVIIDDNFRRALNYHWNSDEGFLLMARMARALYKQELHVIVCGGPSKQKLRDSIDATIAIKDKPSDIAIKNNWVYLSNKKKENPNNRPFEVPKNALCLDLTKMSVQDEVDIILQRIFCEDN